ncbi:MAG: hypothetical protein K8H87_01875, partial [Pseudorhodoplanes sp.]|nr:hypothetical protein [Pseudorhodoplanes sp.]
MPITLRWIKRRLKWDDVSCKRNPAFVLYFAHDPVRKPFRTFPDHALKSWNVGERQLAGPHMQPA